LNVGKVVADHLFEVSLHLVSQDVEGSLRVVSFAVVPDELDVVKGLLYGTVLSGLEFILHLQKVHGMLDDERVVVEL